MSGSPVERLIAAIDDLDIDAAIALVAPDGRLLTADGRRAEGADAVRGLVSEFLSNVRSMNHRVIGQWHQDNVWVAEVEATYELQDRLQVSRLPRAFVLYDGPDGISDLHIYGAHERPLAADGTGEGGLWVGDRWLPPL